MEPVMRPPAFISPEATQIQGSNPTSVLPKPVSLEPAQAPAGLDDRVKVVNTHIYNASVKAKEIYTLMETVAPFTPVNVMGEFLRTIGASFNKEMFEVFGEKILGHKKSYYKDKNPEEVALNLFKDIAGPMLNKTATDLAQQINESTHGEEFKLQLKQAELRDEFFFSLEQIVKERIPNGEIMHLKLAQNHHHIKNIGKEMEAFLDKSFFGALLPNGKNLFIKSLGLQGDQKSNLSLFDSEALSQEAQGGEAKEINGEAVDLYESYLKLLVALKNYKVSADEDALIKLIGDFVKKSETCSFHKIAKYKKTLDDLKESSQKLSSKLIEVYTVLVETADSDSDEEDKNVFRFPGMVGLLPLAEEVNEEPMEKDTGAVPKMVSKIADPMAKETPPDDDV